MAPEEKAEEKQVQKPGKSSGSNVLYQGTKSGADVGVVWCGDTAFRRGQVVHDVPSEVVEGLKDDYYQDYNFDFDAKEES
jgi:hypothetical protein